jgi:outer membrane protein assembly factor BamE
MRKAIILLAAFFCAACSNYSANLPSIKPYKMDIQQGNVVTSKMMMQLRPGMTKSQVRFVMGTPLIADSFHADRWDYLYRMVKGGKIIEQRHVILDFENDQLKRVRGDVIPAGTGEAGVVGDTKQEGAKPVVAPKKKDKGLIDKLKFWKDDEEQAPAKVEPQPTPAKAPQPEPEPVKPAEAKPAPAPEPVKEESPSAVRAEPKPEAVPEKAVPEAAKPQPAEQAAPEPAAEPVKPPEAPAKPAATPESVKTEPAKAEPAKVEPKTAPIPAEDLPPEDDPGYFERMLEKIGF